MSGHRSLAQAPGLPCGVLARVFQQARAAHDLLCIVGAQSLMQSGAMHLDGLDAQTEVTCHLFAAEAVTNEIEYLLLSGAESDPDTSTLVRTQIAHFCLPHLLIDKNSCVSKKTVAG